MAITPTDADIGELVVYRYGKLLQHQAVGTLIHRQTETLWNVDWLSGPPELKGQRFPGNIVMLEWHESRRTPL